MENVKIGGLPVFRAVVSDEECGMQKVSLVDYPAVERDFMTFQREGTKARQMYAIADEEKRLVRGVLMRADFPIYRCDESIGEYYVIYDKDTIRRMAEKYLKDGRAEEVNLMHAPGSDVEGVNLVQYFIKGEGVAVEGFDDVEDGSLMAEYHVENEEVWAAIKDGTYKGFSLEGVFSLEPLKMEIEAVDMDEEFRKIGRRITKFFNIKNMDFKKVITSLAKMLAKFRTMSTDNGLLSWEGDEDLKVDDLVYLEGEDGTRVAPEDGEYKTEDGRVIVVEGGKVASISTEDTDTEKEVQVEDADETETPDGDKEPNTDAELMARLEALEDFRLTTEARLDEIENAISVLADLVEKIAKAPLGDAAHEEFKKTAKETKTLDPRATSLMRILKAGK